MFFAQVPANAVLTCRSGPLRLSLHVSEMPVLAHRVSQRLPPGILAVNISRFAAAIIVEPLDPPLAALLVKLGWFGHRDVPPDARLTPDALFPRRGGGGQVECPMAEATINTGLDDNGAT